MTRMTDVEFDRIVSGDAPNRMSFIVREARRARSEEASHLATLQEVLSCGPERFPSPDFAATEMLRLAREAVTKALT